MTSALAPSVSIDRVTKRYGETTALSDVTVTLDGGLVYGLFGANGSGKTTLMSIIDAQAFPSSGSVKVGGVAVGGMPSALEQICFLRDGQKYPLDATCSSVLRAASLMFPRWSQDAAQQMALAFGLPEKTRVSKLSRGQASALAATVMLAARAPITLLDEPFRGLDVQSRDVLQEFLTSELAEVPRTVLVSSHMVNEVEPLLDRVLILDRGHLVIDESYTRLVDESRFVEGPTAVVEDLTEEMRVLRRDYLGGQARYTVLGPWPKEHLETARRLGLRTSSLALESLVRALSQRTQED